MLTLITISLVLYFFGLMGVIVLAALMIILN